MNGDFVNIYINCTLILVLIQHFPKYFHVGMSSYIVFVAFLV